jgi:hypothetical protein
MLSNHIFEVKTELNAAHSAWTAALLNFDDMLKFMDLLWAPVKLFVTPIGFSL